MKYWLVSLDITQGIMIHDEVNEDYDSESHTGHEDVGISASEFMDDLARNSIDGNICVWAVLSKEQIDQIIKMGYGIDFPTRKQGDHYRSF